LFEGAEIEFINDKKYLITTNTDIGKRYLDVWYNKFPKTIEDLTNLNLTLTEYAKKQIL